MKHSILTMISVFSLSLGSMNSFTMQTQLVLCDPQLEDVRYVNVYPQLPLKTLTRVACVNKLFSKEIDALCLKSNGDKLTAAVVDAFHCYAEDGCYPKIKICTWDILCPSHKKMQDAFVIDCIESFIKPGIWREKGSLIHNDCAAWSLSLRDNNQIGFQSTGCGPQNICIDYEGYKKKATDYTVMSIYSIDRETGLNEAEFNTLVNKDIENPLIVLIDSLIMKTPKNMAFLLQKFKALSIENQEVVGACLTDLQLLDQLYSMTKNLEIDAIIAKWQNPQDYASSINVVNPIATQKINNGSPAAARPTTRQCSIQ